MKPTIRTTLLALITTACLASLLPAQDAAPAAEAEAPAGPPQIPGVEFTEGPARGMLGNQASVNVPEGYVFTGSAGTQRLMELMENPVSGSEWGFLAPADLSWFVVFEYEDTGYVKDDDKDKIDANALLENFRRGTEAGNKVRQERGWGTLEIVGWETPPAYNPATNNLEWATRLRSSDGTQNVNHNIRLLGREGVMSAVLVADPEALATASATTRDLLATGYAFNSGKTYAEFREGDKVAKYGLMGLIAGGAAVLGAKSGAFKYLWKLIIIPIVAVGAWLKRLFKRNDMSSSA